MFSPQPLAGYWEETRFTPKVGELVGDRDRAKQAYRLAGNIIAYAPGTMRSQGTPASVKFSPMQPTSMGWPSA